MSAAPIAIANLVPRLFPLKSLGTRLRNRMRDADSIPTRWSITSIYLHFSQLALVTSEEIPLEICTYKSFQQLVTGSSEMRKVLIFTRTPYIGITKVFIHEVVVSARQFSLTAQLVRALHRYRRSAGSILARGPVVDRHCSWLGVA